MALAQQFPQLMCYWENAEIGLPTFCNQNQKKIFVCKIRLLSLSILFLALSMYMYIHSFDGCFKQIYIGADEVIKRKFVHLEYFRGIKETFCVYFVNFLTRHLALNFMNFYLGANQRTAFQCFYTSCVIQMSL